MVYVPISINCFNKLKHYYIQKKSDGVLQDNGQKFTSLLTAISAYAEGFSGDSIIRRAFYLWKKLESQWVHLVEGVYSSMWCLYQLPLTMGILDTQTATLSVLTLSRTSLRAKDSDMLSPDQNCSIGCFLVHIFVSWWYHRAELLDCFTVYIYRNGFFSGHRWLWFRLFYGNISITTFTWITSCFVFKIKMTMCRICRSSMLKSRCLGLWLV